MKIAMTSIGDIVTGTVNSTVVCFLQIKLKEMLNCVLVLVKIKISFFSPSKFTDPVNSIHGLFRNQWIPS